MTTYQINTPGPGFTKDFRNPAEALDWVERYLPCDRRGYTRRRSSREVAGTVVHYSHVLDTKGRVKTGAVIYPADKREAIVAATHAAARA